jgi:hypothetical protein
MRMSRCAVRSLKISWAQVLEPTNTDNTENSLSIIWQSYIQTCPDLKVRHHCNTFVATCTLSSTNALAASMLALLPQPREQKISRLGDLMLTSYFAIC